MNVNKHRLLALAAAGTMAFGAVTPQVLAAETNVEVEDPDVLGSTDIAASSATTEKAKTETLDNARKKHYTDLVPQ